MSLTALLLSLLVALAPHTTDRDRGETRVERAARLEPVASEMIAATRGDRQLLAAMLVLGDEESHWAAYVTEGRCHEGPPGQRCDVGLARGPWQLHRRTCPRAWEHPSGSAQSLHEEARCAAALLRYGRRKCGSWAGAFGVYAGVGCGWAGGMRRARRMGRVGL
jgi:hypothetical protein